MSYRRTAAALRLKGLKPSERLVLAYLADCENEKTGQCNPSHDTLGKEIGICRRYVIRAVKGLVKAGLISVVRGNRSNDHSFLFGKCNTRDTDNTTKYPEEYGRKDVTLMSHPDNHIGAGCEKDNNLLRETGTNPTEKNCVAKYRWNQEMDLLHPNQQQAESESTQGGCHDGEKGVVLEKLYEKGRITIRLEYPDNASVVLVGKR